MNKLFYLNLVAFLYCVTVLFIQTVKGNLSLDRSVILSILAIANIVIFINALIKQKKYNSK